MIDQLLKRSVSTIRSSQANGKFMGDRLKAAGSISPRDHAQKRRSQTQDIGSLHLEDSLEAARTGTATRTRETPEVNRASATRTKTRLSAPRMIILYVPIAIIGK
jgi:hypothetical protein